MSSRLRLLGISLATLVILLGVWAWRRQATPDPPAAQRYRAAVRSLEEGDLEAAETGLRRTISENPRLADAYAELGNLYLRQKSPERARLLLETAAYLQSARPHVYCQLAEADVEARRHEDARRHLAKALGRAPRCSHALAVQGEMLLRDDDLSGALTAFRASLRADREFALAYLKAGYILLKLQRLDEAEQILKAGLQHDRRNPGLHFYLGETYFQRPRLEKSADLAESHYQQAIPNNPGAANVHSRLADLAWRREDAVVARVHWEQALKLDPSFADALYGMSRLESRAGNRAQSRHYQVRYTTVRQAQRQLESLKAKALARPEDVERACEVARYCLERGLHIEAERQLERAIRREPEHREARELRASLYLARGRLTEARAEYAVAARLGAVGSAEPPDAS